MLPREILVLNTHSPMILVLLFGQRGKVANLNIYSSEKVCMCVCVKVSSSATHTWGGRRIILVFHVFLAFHVSTKCSRYKVNPGQLGMCGTGRMLGTRGHEAVPYFERGSL